MALDLEVGQLVFSKRGRDKGSILVVFAVSGEYALLADGRARPVERPKKKKIKHVQTIRFISEELKTKILSSQYLNNADVARVIERYQKNQDQEQDQ